ncbi:hypothetical protein BC832DRAFT_591706 [Gaertneriomyces semiglobifer]|nr:hypothetical protein BC832DRAFT_591706 [Gaertneriomyces semiglobifer]
MQDMNYQSSPAAGSMQPGSISGNYYTPTVEEKIVIKDANRAFLGRYAAGIACGVAGGMTFVRFGGLRPRSLRAGITVFFSALGGEYVGRKIGEARARQVLGERLPSYSNLRKLLEQNKQGLTIPKAYNPSSTSEAHDYGMEGAQPVRVSPIPAVAHERGSSQSVDTDLSLEVDAPTQEENAWERLRRENARPQTVWDKIRTQGQARNTGVAPRPGGHSDGEEDEDTFAPPTASIIPRTRDELLESERLGHIQRNQYGDLIDPVVAPVGGRGQMGPYGDTVAATPAGGASIPRTREELEDSLSRGRVKRNQWGDLSD